MGRTVKHQHQLVHTSMSHKPFTSGIVGAAAIYTIQKSIWQLSVYCCSVDSAILLTCQIRSQQELIIGKLCHIATVISNFPLAYRSFVFVSNFRKAVKSVSDSIMTELSINPIVITSYLLSERTLLLNVSLVIIQQG